MIYRITYEYIPAFGDGLRIHLQNNWISCKGNLEMDSKHHEVNADFAFQLSEQEIKDLIGNLEKVNIHAIPPSQVGGFDGFTHSLQIQNVQNKAKYSWWVECPSQWKEFGIFVEQLIQIVTNHRPQ